MQALVLNLDVNQLVHDSEEVQREAGEAEHAVDTVGAVVAGTDVFCFL